MSIKSLIKLALLYGGPRSVIVPWALNYTRLITGCTLGLFHRVADRHISYAAFSAVGDRRYGNSDAVNDLPLNFYFRVAASADYAYVIELGALSAFRIIELGRLMKSVQRLTRVYGLDVTADYAIERELDGVIVGPNNLTTIRTIGGRHAGRGLICATGTLCYYAQDDLAAMFALAASQNCDVALVEPNFSVWERENRMSFKRSRISSYHPYVPMLRIAGYELAEGGLQIPRTWNDSAEEWTFIFATRPT